MYNASDLKKGLKIEIEGVPYEIVDFQFVKPGKGQALYKCKLKNLMNGSVVDKTYRSGDSVDQPNFMDREMIFAYDDGNNLVFMDPETFEQIEVDRELLGERENYLEEDMTVDILFHNEKAIEINLPAFVEKKVVETEPGAKGDTISNVTKPAKLEGGAEVPVPVFVNEGDVVRIDTRTGKYSDRVNKA